MLAGRRIDFENLKRHGAGVGERVLCSGRNINDIVLAQCVDFIFDLERAFAAPHDVDVVCMAVVVQLAMGPAGCEPIEVNVDLLGTELRVYELDLLAASALHGMGGAFMKTKDFEHALSPFHACASAVGI